MISGIALFFAGLIAGTFLGIFIEVTWQNTLKRVWREIDEEQDNIIHIRRFKKNRD